jgi:uncharacterized protein (DUF1800 family)
MEITSQLLREKFSAGEYKDARKWESFYKFVRLDLINASLEDLFPYTGRDDLIPPPLRGRPYREVVLLNILEAISKNIAWHEEWVSFWRDHFSIYRSGNEGAFLPHWEKNVIRQHAFGNFRIFLEASASHPCMLFYLNNRSSRSGSANENYARELFELHTLGKSAYLNNLYSQWRTVPGALQGKPQGYIDQDVYEAARAFTGWTVEDGTGIGGGQNLPKTGRFHYVEAWHDNYQKRVLATEFEPYSGPMKDGRKVLDLCAYHPATAKHLMAKSVKRMVSDEPSKELIESTTKVFIQNQKSPEQLMVVAKYLAQRTQAIPKQKRKKVRRPIPLLAAFVRATNLPLDLSEGKIFSPLETAGPPLYGWVSPEGPPDGMEWYLSSAYLKGRFNLLQGLAENWWGTGEFDPFVNLSAKPSYQEFFAYWTSALFTDNRPDLSTALMDSQGLIPNDHISDPRVARKLIGYLACSPSFQTEAFEPILF